MQEIMPVLALIAMVLSSFALPALIYVIKIGNTVQDMKPKFDKHIDESSHVHTMIEVNTTKIGNIEKRMDHAEYNTHHDEHRR